MKFFLLRRDVHLEMFFIHRVMNAVTMMYNEADELTACHFIRPSTYYKHSLNAPQEEADSKQDSRADPEEPLNVESSDDEIKQESKQRES